MTGEYTSLFDSEIPGQESATVEFKVSITRSFLKTVSAYANYAAGKIVFGISDAGEVLGLSGKDTDLSDAALRIENMINDSLSPRPTFSLVLDDIHKVITLNVTEGFDKPYLYQGKAFCRRSTSTVEVDRLELKHLVLDGSNMTFDGLKCDQKSFSFAYLEAQLVNRLGIKACDDDVLKSLGLLNRTGSFTNAAALLADTNAFHGLDIVRFGKSEDIVRDRVILEGMSILRQFDEAVKEFIKYYTYEIIEGVTRKQVESVPLEAFREALANALVHSEWDSPASVAVRFYEDKVTVTSPGGLPYHMTESDFLNRNISNPRNPVLAGIFFRLGLIEKLGIGVARIRRVYSTLSVDPQFEVGDSAITVTLPTSEVQKPLSSDEVIMIEQIENYRVYSRSEIQKRSGFSKDKTIRVLNSLVEKGVVRRDGGGRSVRYLFR